MNNMSKKIYKKLALSFICITLLLSVLALSHIGTRNLSLIDYPPMTDFVKLYIPFGL